MDKYVVVGVVEEYEDFLKVLEKLLPDFFGGILKEFKTSTESKLLYYVIGNLLG